jgi:hypothetical protein
MKLSKAQQRVLDSMESREWYCAYDLRCSLATLNALRKRGLVISKGVSDLGSFAFPRIGIKWQKVE